jgi:hypothetical protein
MDPRAEPNGSPEDDEMEKSKESVVLLQTQKSKEMGLLFVKQGQGFFQRTQKYVKNPRPADSQI